MLLNFSDHELGRFRQSFTLSESDPAETEVCGPFLKRTLGTYKTAPPESQVYPLRMETNLAQSLELGRIGFLV